MLQRPFVVHLRNHRGGEIVGQGGATVVFIPVSEEECQVGVALCNDSDVFNRHEGVERATRRAETGGLIMPRPHNVASYSVLARAMVAHVILERYSNLVPVNKLSKMKTPAEIRNIA